MIYIGLLFAAKVILGALLLVASARWLSVEQFAEYAQYFLGFSLLNSLATGGLQNGLIREMSNCDGNTETRERAVAASITVWAIASGIVLLLCFVFRQPITQMLVGHSRQIWTLPVLAFVAVIGAFGNMMCAILTGRGRVQTATVAQMLGLVAGASLCLFFLLRGQAALAVVGYGAGLLFTLAYSVKSLNSANEVPIRLAATSFPDCRKMFDYSLSFAVASVAMPLALFATRPVYRSQFGVEALSYWIVANRISDVNTQLLALYMAQIALPALSAAKSGAAERRVRSKAIVTGVSLMLLSCAVFILFSGTLVTTLLSAQYLPAIPIITAFLVGDIVRVGMSLALYSALAKGLHRRFTLLELANATLFVLLTYLTIRMGLSEAPAVGYALAFGIVTCSIFLIDRAKGKAPV